MEATSSSTMAPSTVKMAFEVPARPCANGALVMTPFFQLFPNITGGDYRWSIHYYPKSLHAADSIDLCLHLETKGGRATISSSVGLVDPTGALPPVNLVPESPATALDYADETTRSVTHSVPVSLLDDSRYVTRGGCLTFEWTITILSAAAPAAEPQAPARHKFPAATDVTFSVGGELFDAHMLVLALRSPVFKAELFGGTLEIAGDGEAPPTVVVEDMRPDVFQALLCYIYTDDLPPRPSSPEAAAAGHDLEEDENEMLCHLLVAADRYDVRGLKLLCQEILRRKVDVSNVAKMLAFADGRHCCSALKEACAELIADPEVMKEVVASQGYQQLRLKHPLVLLDMLEKCLHYV